MNRSYFVCLVCFLIFEINLFGQDNMVSYLTPIKNERPDYIVFSNDGKHIATGLLGFVRIWEIDSKKFRDYKTKLKNETPHFICFSPDGKYIAAGVFGAI